MGTPVATVVLLRRFPLKSAAGEQPRQVDVGASGLIHDRAWAVVGHDGEPLRARDHPWLADLAARVEGGLLVVRVGDEVLGGAALRSALSARAGRPVDVVALGGSGGAGTAPVHVVSEHAERDPRAPTDCDLGHRANVVLRLDDGVPPGAERTWVGRRLGVGGVHLALTRVPRRCLGAYADVVVPGPLAVGDRAVLL